MGKKECNQKEFSKTLNLILIRKFAYVFGCIEHAKRKKMYYARITHFNIMKMCVCVCNTTHTVCVQCTLLLVYILKIIIALVDVKLNIKEMLKRKRN